jgi:hypothetical protein
MCHTLNRRVYQTHFLPSYHLEPFVGLKREAVRFLWNVRKLTTTWSRNSGEDHYLIMCLYHFSTCFEKASAHHQENQFYQYIVWYITFCVCGRLVCRSEGNSLTCIPDGHLHRVIYARWCIDTIDSPDDEHWISRNMYRSEISTLKSAWSWLLTRIVPRCTVNKILKKNAI